MLSKSFTDSIIKQDFSMEVGKMKIQKRIISLIIVMCLVLPISNIFIISVNADTADSKIKNIIFMIPDGGGMTAFNMSDAVKQAGGFDRTKYPNATIVDKGPMTIKEYWVGAEKTNNALNRLTDSAAAGTALATGNKTLNNYIGINDNKVPVANLLEASQFVGKNTGIVVTYEWTNATPAAFSAHDISRTNAKTMSEQIVNQEIDVVLGGIDSAFSGESWFTDESLKSKGYNLVKSRNDLKNVAKGDRIWGKFPGVLYYDATKNSTTPTLAEMTEVAITALDDDNENGFFLMVEGSAIDGGGHTNSAEKMIGDYIAFDAACKVAIDYAKERNDTIVLIAPDHDTGGMYWHESDLGSIVSQIQSGSSEVTGLKWKGTGHTDWDGGIFMYVPDGVSYPDGIDTAKKDVAYSEFAETNFIKAKTNLIENTELPKYLAKFINVDLDQLSKELFVDISEYGEYNSSTEIFKFRTAEGHSAQIKRNEAKALIDGIEVDLNGEIAVLIEDRFYVPKRLYSQISEYIHVEDVDVMSMGVYDEVSETFTFTDYNASIKRNSNILVVNGMKVDLGEDVAIYMAGQFRIPKKAFEVIQKISAGVSEFKIVADYNKMSVDVSGYIPASNRAISILVLKSESASKEELSIDDIIMVGETASEFNGDFSFDFVVGENQLGSKYTFKMNYTDSPSKTPITKDFTFQNTIPAMLVETANGDEVMYMDQLRAGDDLKIKLSGFDFSDDFQGAIIVSQCDGDDKLVEASVLPVSGGSVEIGTEIEESVTVTEGIKTIKVMYWNWSTLAPVFGKYTIKSKE